MDYTHLMTATENLERSLHDLPTEERDQIASTLVGVIESLDAAGAGRDSERRALVRELNDALQLLHAAISSATGSGKSQHLAQAVVRELLASNSILVEKPSLAELEKRNTANRLAQWSQAVRESLDPSDLAANGVSRQQLEQWRKRRKLIGLRPPFKRGFVYPAWEFDQDVRPRNVIPDLAEAADEAHLDPLSLHRLMVSETATPQGPLMHALTAGDDHYVLSVVRAAGALGS